MSAKLAQKIKRLRKEQNLTQIKLAKKAGIAQSFLSNIENDLQSPSLKNLEKISKALDISLPDLLK
ncbi:helix-turn-helix domain-containing protein [Halanaerobium salsuginis]|jgi:transcriptional regulator with XRE-family HTH domain|uniref:Helix-turn-helix n=1 Tax=Halanaerobium salsuginis TaxID=29563 RepID=A0A1I4I0J2_9FIRM|nr:helix-turn-helix transcriptional regulator [Halanaerobium salsuginis]SFL47700.1 Helix-turn-helix [Halanaerobium salsuginis]